MSEYTAQFSKAVNEAFNKIEDEEDSMELAATKIADAIEADELIHVIGPGGHSNIGAHEMFYRAGGLVPVNPILDPGTALIHGARRSTYVERTPGYAKAVLDAYDVQDGVMVIVNAYGINAMTIDCALEAKERGLTSIGITSTSFAEQVPSDHPARHPTGKNLHESVDVFIDSHMPYGDAIVEFDDIEQKVAPTSTLVNCYVIDLMTVKVVETLRDRGVDVPLWMSANLPGGDEANEKYFEEYVGRVKHLQ